MTTIGYSQFIELFEVDDPQDWWDGLRVCTDGVWVVPPSDNTNLTPAERAILTEHPKNDLTVPALSFPCNLNQLKDFLEYFEFTDYLSQEEIEKYFGPDTLEMEITRAAEPEISNLHRVLKKIGFSEKVKDREPKYKKAIEAYFEKNRPDFKYVKAEHLIDRDLYGLYRAGQEKGDFIGKLLVKIYSDNGISRGYQRAYEIFKDVMRSKTD